MTSEDASTRHPQDASVDDPTASLSPNGSSTSQVTSWPRPRSPIPPHRLAKLANALGISTPIPLSQASDDSVTSASFLSKPLTPDARRSPAPSVASTPQLISHSPVPFSQSKFLLHVVPPLHIPHDSDSSEGSQLTPPPPSASGYHTQFKRGTLVPLLPTLQSQLWAIAKEYALPSTTGIILYLVSSTPSPNPEATLTVPDEPGPRLSEDIWKHLWMRVSKFENESYSRMPTPNPAAGLDFGYLGPPSPLFPQEFTSSNTLRPLVSPGRVTPQFFPPPLTPTGSIASSNPPTQATPSETETSQSEVHTPDSSLPSDSRAATLDLPGLTSPSVIPILAKVEFDIDKRRAAWYGPWIRSRKLNHQKREQRARTESDAGTPSTTEDVSRGDVEQEVPNVAPLPLRLVDRQAIPRFLLSASEEVDDSHEASYPCLSESPPVLDDFEPNGTTLSEQAETEDDPVDADNEALLGTRERPKLALEIPFSPPDAMVHPPLPTVEAAAAATYKKAVPPPLILVPYPHDTSISEEASPLPTSSSTGLAYLRDGASTPSDGGKRTGTVFDDMDLGLEFEDTGEFDESDPNDRRRSQYVFKAKLDEIEKTLVRLSPRGLQHEITRKDRQPSTPSSASEPSTLEQGSNELPNKPSAAWPSVPHSSPNRQGDSPLGFDKFLAPPKLSVGGGSHSAPVSPFKKSLPLLQDRESDESNARRREPHDHEFTFPKIDSPLRKSASFNTSPTIPLSPDPFGRFPSSHSPPSTAQPSTSLDVSLPQPQPRAKFFTSDSSSEQRSSRASLGRKESLKSLDAASRPPSSRFSLDSIDEGTNNRASASLNPVKSIRSLWKRGRKASISFVSGSSPATQAGLGNSSPPLPPPVPSLSSASGTSTPLSSTFTPSSTSRESVASLGLPPDRHPHPPQAPYYDTRLLPTSQLQHSHSSPSMNSMIFNQESPYPVHVIPPHSSARPRTASQAARIVVSTASFAEVDVMPEREKAGPRKSILKSRRTDSSASPLPPDLLGTRKSLSRVDTAVTVRSGALAGVGVGGGVTPPPPSSSTAFVRVLSMSSRRRSGRAAALPRPSPEDESFETAEPVPRLELDQRTR